MGNDLSDFAIKGRRDRHPSQLQALRLQGIVQTREGLFAFDLVEIPVLLHLLGETPRLHGVNLRQSASLNNRSFSARSSRAFSRSPSSDEPMAPFFFCASNRWPSFSISSSSLLVSICTRKIAGLHGFCLARARCARSVPDTRS